MLLQPRCGDSVLYWAESPTFSSPVKARIERVVSSFWVSVRCEDGRLVEGVALVRNSWQSPFGDCCVLETPVNRTPINCALVLVGPQGSGKPEQARRLATVSGGTYFECEGPDLDRPTLHYPDVDAIIVNGLPQTDLGRGRLALLVVGVRAPDVILLLDDATPRAALEFLGDRRVVWQPVNPAQRNLFDLEP